MSLIYWMKTRLVLAGLGMALAMPSALGAPWSFGVMDDTQWVGADPDGQNPDTVPVSIIAQINAQFVDAGVKFVFQVGDLSESGSNAALQTRAAAAQPLIDAGIGFFPLRGNHETYGGGGNSYGIPQFQASFPQTQGGTFTKTGGANFGIGGNFNSPVAVDANLAGMSYSFDYGTAGNNARFVILDNWRTPANSAGNSVNDQQNWIGSRLDKSARGTTQAFVLSHQPLIGAKNVDTLFGANPSSNPSWQNTFIGSLADNEVKVYHSGHDHLHQNSVIVSPDGLSRVHQIIGASDSNKFYTPHNPSNDNGYNGTPGRETPISQDLYRVGYYIYSVDGPRVTVSYHASTGAYPAGFSSTPVFTFQEMLSFGYSLNGKEFLVGQGQSYTTVQDQIAAAGGFFGTRAAILAGVNGSTLTDASDRPLTKAVNTGWTAASGNLKSDILSLWGMADAGAGSTDQYVLSLSFDPSADPGAVFLASRDVNGDWVNAVDLNTGGGKQFVLGAYSGTYGLGSYGVDPATHTAWAVLNHASEFTVVAVPEPETYVLMLAGLGLVGSFARRSRQAARQT